MSTSARSRGSRVERPRTDRYAAMDGYRGLFVLLVIAYHFGATGLVGGWVGINHFFVFSGLLIARTSSRNVSAPVASTCDASTCVARGACCRRCSSSSQQC